MRKVILFMHLSFDGFVCGPDGEQDWMTMNDDEMGKYMTRGMLQSVDTILTGRKLYESFARFWPGVPQMPDIPPELVEFAHWMNNTQKVVFSKTIHKGTWTNSAFESGNIADAVNSLKQQPGGDMIIFGGAETVQEFTRLNLVDEYRIKLEPVILGKGKLLFKNDTDRLRLKLTQSNTFASGVVGLYYDVIK